MEPPHRTTYDQHEHGSLFNITRLFDEKKFTIFSDTFFLNCFAGKNAFSTLRMSCCMNRISVLSKWNYLADVTGGQPHFLEQKSDGLNAFIEEWSAEQLKASSERETTR